MYARQQDNKIKLYNSIPEKWNGINNYISGFSLLNETVWNEEGFYIVEEPVYDKELQKLGDIYFDINKFTYPVINIIFVLDDVYKERMNEIIALADEYFSDMLSLCTEDIVNGEKPKYKEINDAFILWYSGIKTIFKDFKTANNTTGLVKYKINMEEYEMHKDKIKEEKKLKV